MVTQTGRATAVGKQTFAQNPNGFKVERATADVFTSAAVGLFRVVGRVRLLGILGEVTTIIGAGTTPDTKLQFNPVTGTTIDLCATATVASDEVGTLYSLDGTPATAMIITGSSGATRNIQNRDIMLNTGDIEVICDEDVSGSVKWTLWYLPIDDGAYVVAI